MKKIVVLGGGTGQSVLLRGLKRLSQVDLSAIVTVADDGGSTGRIRNSFNIPAMGDIRHVMVAMAPKESLLSTLMDYRFSEHSGELSGHNLGNLILTAMTENCGSFMQAIADASSVLRINGRVLPSTLEIVTLYARMQDGTIVRGESNIPNAHNHIAKVYYDHPVKAMPRAVQAIQEADLILLGIGSLYTSILPNLIIEELRAAINTAKAPVYYVCNVMTQLGETDHYSSQDHVQALFAHGLTRLNGCIVADDVIPPELIEKYATMQQEPVPIVPGDVPLIHEQLLTFSDGVIRHDPLKIEQLARKLVNDLEVS